MFLPDLLQQHSKKIPLPSMSVHVNILKAAEIIFFKVWSHDMPLKLINIALFLITYCLNSEMSFLPFGTFFKILAGIPLLFSHYPTQFPFFPACFRTCRPSLHMFSFLFSPLLFWSFTKNTYFEIIRMYYLKRQIK